MAKAGSIQHDLHFCAIVIAVVPECELTLICASLMQAITTWWRGAECSKTCSSASHLCTIVSASMSVSVSLSA